MTFKTPGLTFRVSEKMTPSFILLSYYMVIIVPVQTRISYKAMYLLYCQLTTCRPTCILLAVLYAHMLQRVTAHFFESTILRKLISPKAQ